jgi:hypothetical protein
MEILDIPIYRPFDGEELEDFKEKINFYMKKADEYLGVMHEEKGGFLYRNLLNKSGNVSEMNRYKSEVFSNLALATTRLRGVFELIDMEVSGAKKRDEMKEEIYKNFEEIFKSFQDELKKEFIDEKNFHQETKKLVNINFELNTKIYRILKENSLHHNLGKKMDILNGLQNMHFEKKIIVTNCYVDEEQKYTRQIMDKPLEPMSKEMKERIKSGNYKNDFWYESLSKFQKNVFERYKNQIISGHPIPNMINFIPGVRNAFERIDIIKNDNDNEIARTSLIHTAHLTAIGSKKSKDLTKENIKHLRNITGKKLLLLGLVTPAIFNVGERKMHKDLKDAIRKNKPFLEKIKEKFLILCGKNEDKRETLESESSEEKLLLYGNVAINMFRVLQLRMFKKRDINDFMRESLKEIIYNSENQDWGIDNESLLIKDKYYDKKSFSIKKLIEEAKNLNLNEKSLKILEVIEFLDKNLNHKSRLEIVKEQLSGTNIALEINSNLQLLSDLMNDFEQERGEKKSEMVYFCKSGKDRTGIATEYAIAKGLSDKQNIFSERELLKNSIESNHLRFMNGSQYGGNAPGLNGILGRPTNVHSEDYQLFEDNLYNSVAEGNHFKYKKGGILMKLAEFIENIFTKNVNK